MGRGVFLAGATTGFCFEVRRMAFSRWTARYLLLDCRDLDPDALSE